jgi:uncharacterized protein
MPITLSSATVPILQTMLRNLQHCLNKAVAHCEATQSDAKALVQFRLFPNMLPFSRQIMIACDASKFGVARLSGVEAPKFADDETTFEELIARIQKTLDYITAVDHSRIDGQEDKDITFPVGRDGSTRTMKGEAYVKHWVLPNVFFHVTTAYNILRHNGVPLGKMDYLAGDGL